MSATVWMPHRRSWALAVLALVASAGALSGQDRPGRRWLPAPRLEATIDGTPGRELNDPQVLLGTRDGNVVVFDYGDFNLRAFSPTGQALWSFGRRGSGPGEFQGISDLELTDTGDIAAFDQDLQRLTVVTTGGRLRSTTAVEHRGYSLVPLNGGRAFGVTPSDQQFLWRWAYPQGNKRDESLPPDVAVDHPLIRTTYTAGAGPSGAIAAFHWSDVLLLLDRDGRARKAIRGPEVIPFPKPLSVPAKVPGIDNLVVTRVAPGAPRATVEVAATSSRAFVLFGGTTRDRSKIVDVYEVPSGRYLGSLLLPERALAITTLPNNRLATLHDDPLPRIRVWQIAPGGPRAEGM